jgi:putative hydrolase of the HAD superfamily
MLRAVTFDFWQTLVSERRGVMRAMQVDRWIRRLAETDQPRDRSEIESAFAANWERFEERWRTNEGQYGAADTVDFVTDRLGVRLEDGLRERLVDGFSIVGETAPLEVAPSIEETLITLRDAGMKLGIVCDVGLTPAVTLRRRLEGLGLLRYFDAWAFSDETGWFKPAPEAFAPALEALEVAPEDAAHVGDNERTDLVGARSLGMAAIQYTGLHHVGAWLPEQDPSPMADHVIDDHAKLPEVLGIV